MKKVFLGLLCVSITTLSSAGMKGFAPPPQDESEKTYHTLPHLPQRFDPTRQRMFAGKPLDEIDTSQQRKLEPIGNVSGGYVYSLSSAPSETASEESLESLESEGSRESLRSSNYFFLDTEGFFATYFKPVLTSAVAFGALGSAIEIYYNPHLLQENWLDLGWKEEDSRLGAIQKFFLGSTLGGFGTMWGIYHNRKKQPTLEEESLKRRWWGGYQDRRRRVDNHEIFPWVTFGELQMEYEEEGKGTVAIGFGSGTLIGDKYVLTAGHNLYDRKKQIFPDKVTFSAGKKGDQARWKAQGERFVIPRQYIEGSLDVSREWDISVLKLDSDIGMQAGYLGVIYQDSSQMRTLSITGYPGEKRGILHTMQGPFKHVSSSRMFYDIDTTPGQSGSSVCMQENLNHIVCTYGTQGGPGDDVSCVVGVHTMGIQGDPNRKHNNGTYITKGLYSSIESWLGI